MTTRFGVWYDGGGFDCGWLAEEHNHGRQCRAEYPTLEAAEKVVEREAYHDKETVFLAAPLDVEHEELFKKARRVFNQGRLSRAKAELDRAQLALDESPDPRPTAYDRLLDEDDP